MATPTNSNPALIQIDAAFGSPINASPGFTMVAGRSVVVPFTHYASTNDITSITIGGTTATFFVSAKQDGLRVGVAWASNIAASDNNISFTTNGGADHYFSMGATEWAETLTESGDNDNVATTFSNTPTVSTKAATVDANTIVFAAATISLGSNDVGFTGPTGWTVLYTENNNNDHASGRGAWIEETTTGTKTATFGTNTTGQWLAAIVALAVSGGGPAATADQEGFRFGLDDGNEAAHTWKDAQDTNVTADIASPLLLRALVNTANDYASTAFALRAQKNGAGGYAVVPVGPSVTEVLTVPTIAAIGTAASGTTSAAPSYPTGISAATSKLICIATGRSNTAGTAATMPAGWTSIGAIEDGTGTWAVDTGTRRVDVFLKDTTTGSESGTVTVSLSGTTANTLRATIIRVEVPSSSYVLDLNVVTGADTTNDTSYSATSSSNLALDVNRLLVITTAQNIDTGTATSRAVTATGITFGTITNIADTAVTNGNDHRHVINVVPVNAGSATVPITLSYTVSVAASGPTLFLSMRARLPAVTNQIYVSTSSNIAAGGEATTARLTAPSGKTTGDFTTGRRWDDENGTDSIDIVADRYTELEWSLNTQSPVAEGDYFDFRVYAGASPLNTYTVTPRLTISSLPLLTSPTGAATGTTTATGSVSTNKASGTLYVVVTQSATQPSIAQIQAGQDHTGAAAAYATSETPGATGVRTFNATGLTLSTTYYFHFQQRDALSNDTTVATSASFTTTSGGNTDGLVAARAIF